jgi:hypothetical protein
MGGKPFACYFHKCTKTSNSSKPVLASARFLSSADRSCRSTPGLRNCQHQSLTVKAEVWTDIQKVDIAVYVFLAVVLMWFCSLCAWHKRTMHDFEKCGSVLLYVLLNARERGTTDAASAGETSGHRDAPRQQSFVLEDAPSADRGRK